jgi:hypothetical protein
VCERRPCVVLLLQRRELSPALSSSQMARIDSRGREPVTSRHLCSLPRCGSLVRMHHASCSCMRYVTGPCKSSHRPARHGNAMLSEMTRSPQSRFKRERERERGEGEIDEESRKGGWPPERNMTLGQPGRMARGF